MTDVKKNASQLEVGEMVKMAEGDYAEIVDLKLAHRATGAMGVAVFVEGGDGAIVVNLNSKVKIAA